MQKLSILWITDPWETLAHDQDTTLRLMQEALKMGIPTYWSGSDFILKTKSPATLNVVQCPDSSLLHLDQIQPVEIEASSFHQLHYRVDPPVDFNYIALIEAILKKGIEPKRFLNPPDLLERQSEKLPPSELAALCPRFTAIYRAEDAVSAYEKFKMDPRVVTKPLNTAQSQGVKQWKTPSTLSEWTQLFKTETDEHKTPIMVEEFLPGVNDGEVRVWFACGEVVAALKKYPKTGDFRVLIDEGSVIRAYTLTESERYAAEQVGIVLKKQGAAMAAIDFISGKISDYNITSPGLLIQLENVHGGQNFAKVILEKLLQIELRKD